MAITTAMCTSFKVEILNGIHAFGTTVARGGTTRDTFYCALYTSSAALDSTTTTYTTSGEVATAGGYEAPGKDIGAPAQVPTSTGTTAWLDFTDVTWSTSSITANGAMIYNYTQGGASGKAVAILAFGGDRQSTSGNFTIVFPTANSSSAIIRIA